MLRQNASPRTSGGTRQDFLRSPGNGQCADLCIQATQHNDLLLSY